MRTQLRQVGVDSIYLLIGFPAGIAAFVLLVTGFFLGVGTLVLFVGVFVLMVTLLIARAFADLERRMLPEVLGRPVARPRYRPAPATASRLRRAVNPLTNGQSWLDLVHGILNFPFAILGFVATVVWWSVAVTGLLWPAFGWILYRIPGNTDLPEILGLGDDLSTQVTFHFVVGLVFAVTLPFVLRFVALLKAGLSRALLTGVAELHERIDDLSEGRAAAVSAEANALRRLERDIHDGPQQRLVHLAMELSRAQRQVTKDPAAAEVTLAAAIDQTRETLDELRTLSRGIAPPILTDRGLGPALTALAGRCTIPVELAIGTAERFPAAVENTAYFVVAESLTNVAKHSQAQSCTISLTRDGDVLTLAVGDDGVGGAHVAKGHGLAGLADRLRAVDGQLIVRSAAGGPTVIGAEIPCA